MGRETQGRGRQTVTTSNTEQKLKGKPQKYQSWKSQNQIF